MKKSKDINELLAMDYEPRKPWLPPFFSSKMLGMIHSWTGVGKTNLALWMAYSLASGGSFLKWEGVTPARVLYVDSEMSEERVLDRVRQIVLSADCDSKPGHFRTVAHDSFDNNEIPDISTPKGQEWLRSECVDRDVIFIDNLEGVIPLTKDNEERVWLKLKPLLIDLRAQGKCIVILHHSNKSGTQHGSSVKERPLDWTMHLRRPGDYEMSDGARFDIIFEKGRSFRGEQMDSLSVWYKDGVDGRQFWDWEKRANSNESLINRMYFEKMTDLQISKETGLPLFTIKQMTRKFKQDKAAAKKEQEKDDFKPTFAEPKESEDDCPF